MKYTLSDIQSELIYIAREKIVSKEELNPYVEAYKSLKNDFEEEFYRRSSVVKQLFLNSDIIKIYLLIVGFIIASIFVPSNLFYNTLEKSLFEIIKLLIPAGIIIGLCLVVFKFVIGGYSTRIEYQPLPNKFNIRAEELIKSLQKLIFNYNSKS